MKRLTTAFFMFLQILSYIKFQSRATNRHGVHPPFAYRFLDEVVYQKRPKENRSDRKTRRREYELYQRMLDYFKPENAFLLDDDDFFRPCFIEYQKRFPNFYLSHGEKEISKLENLEMIVLNKIENPHEILDLLKKMPIKNDSFVIIPQLRASKQQRDFWELLIHDSPTRLNLEFYHYGISFFRKESSKEYFSIRY